jgi:hypothetical protein
MKPPIEKITQTKREKNPRKSFTIENLVIVKLVKQRTQLNQNYCVDFFHADSQE